MDFKTPADELRAHLLMLANLDGKPVYWLNSAQIYGELPGRPVTLIARAQTCAILRAQLDGPRVVRTFYREAGLYLEPETDRLLSDIKNPVTGKITPVETAFREGPATFTYTATDEGVFGATELDQKTTRQMPWTWHSSGPRVWMINEDAGIWKPADPASDRIQSRDPLAGRILQTWYADRNDLENSKLASAPCFKTYVMTTSAWPSFAGDPGEPGCGFIRGIGTKLTPMQAAGYPECIRLRRAHPDFFADAETAR